jgi:predicted nucleic acid-binding protein
VPGIALDCSAALALFLDDEQPPLAVALLDALPGTDVWIPILWRYEFANVLLTAQRRRRLTPARSVQILGQAARLPLHVDTEAPSTASLFELAATHGLTAYDAAYLELSQRRQLHLATLDTQLAKAAAAAGVELFDGKPANCAHEPATRYRKRPVR